MRRGVELAGGDLDRELARGGGDLFAPAVRERERERHLVVADRRLRGADRAPRARPRGRRLEIADGDEADVVLEDLVLLAHQELAEQAHQRVDLARRARPVLLAEGVERERVEPEPAADADDAPNRGAPGLVPGLARLAPRLGPAAVAVHDDADVAGEVSGFDEDHRDGRRSRAR